MSRRSDHDSRRFQRAAQRAAAVALAAATACAALPAIAHAAPPLGWSPTGQIDASGLSSVSCASEALCVAVDHAGNALSSSDPGSLVPSWSAPSSIDPGASLNSLSCAAPSSCVAVDGLGAALASTNPREGGWSRTPIDGGRALTGVACPSASLCVAVDEAGNVLSTEHPGSSWSKPEAIDAGAGRRLQGVSCASASLCVAVDSVGNALASASPTGGAAAWHLRSIAPSRELVSVSCTPAGFCAALDSQGNALASQNPAASTPTWSLTPIDAGGHPTALSCASSGLCVAVDDRGLALASDEPLAPVPNWSESSDGSVLTSISCLAAGFCVAGDPAGRAVTARVPPPEVASATPSVIADTSATLAGVVNPHDATIGSCRFEYGTTLPYSQSIPCASPPATTNAAQLVTAPLTGLSANTLYHYRVVASSAIGSAAGADASFTTAVSSLVALVLPHPSISGTPAVGQRLACHPNTPSGAAAQLTYAWLRDLIAIPRSSASTYVVKGADTAHHLQCQVTATNAGGSATARSSFVTIPVQGIPASAGETIVRPARFSGGKLNVPIVCSPRAISGCRLLLRVTVARRHATVTLARVRVRMARGEHRTVAVALNRTGRRLLAARHRVAAKLTVSGTVIGVIESTLAQQKVLLGASARGARTAHAASAASTRARARASSGHVLAPTPYMGWDSYFAFGGRYSEATVLEQASELLHSGLARQGYRYVWLDVGWWHGKRDASGEISVSSSQWPHGMAWLAHTLHAAGLLVGLYTDAGPNGCGGAGQGSYGHYQQDANSFAAWGFDAVKVDFCGGAEAQLSPAGTYAAFHAAIAANASHRPMLLSICNFLQPEQYAEGQPSLSESAFSSYTFGPGVGNSWRTDTDVGTPGHVSFAEVLRNMDADAASPQAAGPGHWNDPDYLGPDQGLSAGQFRSQLSMWAILAAPLMISADLTRISRASRAAVGNPEVIAIDQDPAGIQGTLVSTAGSTQVWVRPLVDGSRAVALLNRGSSAARVRTSAAAVGIEPAAHYQLRNVWAHTTAGTGGGIIATVPPGGTVLLRVFAR